MIAAAFFVLAFFVRACHLEMLPIHYDEATYSLGSLQHFDRFMGIPVMCFQGYIRPIFSYLVFISNKFFSLPVYIVRVPAALIGALTVALVYAVAKEMYNKKTGLFSALFLAFLPWHVIQSRRGDVVVLVPFFGCVIFYTLLLSLKRKSRPLYMLSWASLGIGSLYSYQGALIYVVIFISVLFSLKREFRWLKARTVLVSLLLFLVLLFPLAYMNAAGRIDFLSFRPYHHNPFQANVFANLFENLKNNSVSAIKSLFLPTGFGALQSPLLISWVSLAVIIYSLLVSLYRRAPSDKIILGWLALGFLGSVAFVNNYEPRYIVIILVPLLILIARGAAGLFDFAFKSPLLMRRVMIGVGTFLCAGLFSLESQQLLEYYRRAPADLEEYFSNAYGCKEAAGYLSGVQGIEKCRIVTDNMMTVFTYLKYDYHIRRDFESYLEKRPKDKQMTTYYITWAPASHPKGYWGGIFSHLYPIFRQRYPQEMPVKTVYYPCGLSAIYIFKVVK